MDGAPLRPAAASPAVLVECYGPAGAGKTTFAAALVDRLAALGHPARLVSSARPGEGAGARAGGAIGRVAKLVRAPGRSETAGELLALLPVPGPLWRLRFHRYMARLERDWLDALARGGVVVFDQAWLSALGTLAGLSAEADAGRLGAALGRLPRADLALRLDAPRAVLRDRLEDRLARQGRIERRLELGLDAALRQVGAFAAVDAAAAREDLAVLRLASRDPAALHRGLQRATGRVAALARPLPAPLAGAGTGP